MAPRWSTARSRAPRPVHSAATRRRQPPPSPPPSPPPAPPPSRRRRRRRRSRRRRPPTLRRRPRRACRGSTRQFIFNALAVNELDEVNAAGGSSALRQRLEEIVTELLANDLRFVQLSDPVVEIDSTPWG